MTASTASAPLTSCELRTIRLLGDLGAKFGRVHRLAVKSPAEAVRALMVLKQGFREYLEGDGRRFKLFVKRAGVRDVEREIHMHHAPDAEFVIAPLISGAKRGWAAIVLGVALVGLALTNPVGWEWLAQGSLGYTIAVGVGFSMVLNGVSQLISPQPKFESPENKPSYLFNGPVQTAQQGYPVPVGYGELIIGGAPITASTWSEDLPK